MPSAEVLQQVLLGGDLSRLTPDQRVNYYRAVCESLGLNPLTQPFAYLVLNGKTALYARKEATEQLRHIHNISIDPRAFAREVIEGVYIVTAPASMPNGRTDVSTGAVPIDGLKGEARANAMMKAETKAKRRVTLSICGLGMLDETEVGSITDAQALDVNPDTGEIRELPSHAHVPQPQRASATAASGNGAALPKDADQIATLDKFPKRDKPDVFWWQIVTARAVKAYTWDTKIGALLETFKAEGAPIVLDTAPTASGNKIVNLQRYAPSTNGGGK